MAQTRDWQGMRQLSARLLKERTGEDVDTWNRRIKNERLDDEKSLRAKNRVDLGLRLDGQKPGGRLQPSKIHETMQLQISLTTRDEVDSEVLGWLQQAYNENC
jgi:hypothetical protein